MMTDRSTTHVDRTASVRRAAFRRAFTLVEVLMAAIILAIGLVGLAAVFPAVITQQQAANDLTTAVSVSGTADGILATRLPFFRSRFSDPNVIDRLGTAWNRINAVEDQQSANAFYLQTPYLSPFPDLRLREDAIHVVPDFGIGGPSQRNYPRVILPRRPIALDLNAGDLEVVVTTDQTTFKLIPDESGPSRAPIRFKEGANAFGRLSQNPNDPNSIDYRNAIIAFNFDTFGETVQSIEVHFRWLNDRIVSHPDRLYPTNAPRYGWELAFRRTVDGQLQYTTFIYRFDGMNRAFEPEIPGGRRGIPNSNSAGMLRLGSATVAYNQVEDRFELRTSGRGMADQVEAGSWLLPVDGTGVLRVRRLLLSDRRSLGGSPWFELEGPPMWVDPTDGIAKPMTGTIDFWYMPTTIKAFSDQGQEIGVWRIRPLLATTKQVQL